MNMYQSFDNEIDFLNARIDYLTHLINEKRMALDCAPPGFLRGNSHGKGYQYYRRRPDSDKWQYLRKCDRKIAQSLAQKVYDKKVLQMATAERSAAIRLCSVYRDGMIEGLFDSMPEFYHDIVTPIDKKPEDIYHHWFRHNYSSKGRYSDEKVYISKLGEVMRSKSELYISELFIKYNIPYLYEKPLAVKSPLSRSGYLTLFPDFSLMDFVRRREIYWEHMGFWDNEVYRNDGLRKLRTYDRNDIKVNDRLLLSFESGKVPVDLDYLESKIKSLSMCMAPDIEEYQAYVAKRSAEVEARKLAEKTPISESIVCS